MTSIPGAIFHLAVIIFIAFWVKKKVPMAGGIFWPALTLKLACGIALGLLYTFYYPVADTFVYFTDGSKLADVARNSFLSYLQLVTFNHGLESMDLAMLEPRALFLSKLTSAFNLVTLDNYWAISLYFSAVSFSGAWYLVMVIRRNIPSISLPAVLAFLFMPSVVFWTSGLLKESIAIAAFFFLCAFFLKVWFGNRIRWWKIVIAIFALWVFWNLKYYYAGVFIAVAVTSLAFRMIIPPRTGLSPAIQSVVWLTMLMLLVALVSFLHPNFNLDRVSEVIVSNNEAYNSLSDPGDYVRFQSLSAEPISLLRNAPWALLSGLFRPFIWETSSILPFLQGLENAMLFLFFIVALFRVKAYVHSPHRLLILATLVFIVITAVLITMSTPNFGTLSRYRVGYLSFFALIVLSENRLLTYLQRSLPGLSRVRWKS